jgi:hypothetical protein
MRVCIIYTMYQWPRSKIDPQLFYKYFYNHASRLPLEKLLPLELSIECPTDFFNHFWIQVAVSLLKPPHGYM